MSYPIDNQVIRDTILRIVGNPRNKWEINQFPFGEAIVGDMVLLTGYWNPDDPQLLPVVDYLDEHRDELLACVTAIRNGSPPVSSEFPFLENYAPDLRSEYQ